jgi:hypothetical protein
VFKQKNVLLIATGQLIFWEQDKERVLLRGLARVLAESKSNQFFPSDFHKSHHHPILHRHLLFLSYLRSFSLAGLNQP